MDKKPLPVMNMSMPPMDCRQSILQRKRKTTYFNKENRDIEYEREQKKLEAKRLKRMMQDEYMRKCLWGTKQEQRELQYEKFLSQFLIKFHIENNVEKKLIII